MPRIELVIDARKAAEGAAQMQAAGDTVVNSAIQINNYFQQIDQRVDALKPKLQETAKGFDLLGSSAGKAIDYLKGLLAPLAAMLTIKAVTESIVGFDSGLDKLGRVSGLTGKQLDALGETATRLASRMPVAADSLLAIGTQAARLGNRSKADIEAFMETVGRVGKAAMIESDVAVAAFDRILRATGESAANVRAIGAELMALQKTAGASGDTILASAEAISRSAGRFKLTSAEVMGLGAAFAAARAAPEQAGMAFAKVMGDMQKAVREGGDALQTFAKVSDQSIQEFSASFRENSTNAFLRFVGGLNAMLKSGQDVGAVLEQLGLDSERGARAVIELATAYDRAAASMKAARQQAQEPSALPSAFSGVPNQWQGLKNTVSATIIEGAPGRGAAAGIEATLKGASETIRVFAGMESGMQQASAVAEVLGNALRGVAAAFAVIAAVQMVQWISQLVAWMLTLVKSIESVQFALFALKYAMVTNPVTAVAVAVGSLVAALGLLYDWFGKTTDKASQFEAKLSDMPQSLSGVSDAVRRLSRAEMTGKLNDQLAESQLLLKEVKGVIDQLNKESEAGRSEVVTAQAAYAPGQEPNQMLRPTEIGQAIQKLQQANVVDASVWNIPSQLRTNMKSYPSIEGSMEVGDAKRIVQASDAISMLGKVEDAVEQKIASLTGKMREQSSAAEASAQSLGALSELLEKLKDAEYEATIRTKYVPDEADAILRRKQATDEAAKAMAPKLATGEISLSQWTDAIEVVGKQADAASKAIKAFKEGEKAFEAVTDAEQAFRDEFDATLEQMDQVTRSMQDEISVLHLEGEARQEAMAVMQLEAQMRKALQTATQDEAAEMVDRFEKAKRALASYRAAVEQQQRQSTARQVVEQYDTERRVMDQPVHLRDQAREREDVLKRFRDQKATGSPEESMALQALDTKQYAQQADQYKQMNDALERERQLIGATNEERQRAAALLDMEKAGYARTSDEARKYADAVYDLERAKRAESVNRDISQQARSLDDEIKLSRMSADEAERARQTWDLQRRSVDENGNAIAGVTDRVAELDAKLKQLQENRKLAQLADQIGNSFADAFTDIVTGAKNAADAMKNLANEINRMVIRQVVMQPLADAISGSIKGINFGGSGKSIGTPVAGTPAEVPMPAGAGQGPVAAKGLAFDAGSVLPFSAGGVLYRASYEPCLDTLPFGRGAAIDHGAILPFGRGAILDAAGVVPFGRGGALDGGAVLPFNRGGIVSAGDVIPFGRGGVIERLAGSLAAQIVPFARGGVVWQGMAQPTIPFAAGGIVSRPTYFGLTGGRLGLMGESGPEAIMPLTRDKQGRLGVRALIEPFASGGVAMSATSFPTATGKLGVMGEAGPEAIMPLTRTADGKLGVKAQGSNGGGQSITVHQTININTPNADSFRRSNKQVAADMQTMAARAMRG